MEKTYAPHKIEKKYRKIWEEGNFFSAKNNSENTKYYTIVLPPPNVTGTLHMGHAFQHTIMDILIRYYRIKGYQTLWQPGTDHAGIATQMVVERQLEKEKINKRDLGREKFIEKIWDWKKESGNQITSQMRQMGLSVDWERERFTMDEGLCETVSKVFIDLYNKKLIYRGKRLVNWDPVLQTAISDLEVVSTLEKGKMYYIRYQLVDSDEFINIATTRPETILADSALAINPEDQRFNKYLNKYVHVPLTNRTIPIIADKYVDSEFGTGCVKITPAHDFNDWEVGQRHNLEVINIMTRDAKLNENCQKKYVGLDRFQARKLIIKDLDEKGLLERIENHEIKLPRGDRTGAVVEPYLTNQWFVDAKKMAEKAIKVVKDEDIRFVPKNWEKTYFNWLENIEDWCISRQIWWGHRIPAYFDEKGNVYVASSIEEARKQAGENVNLTQDEDVLDTWFSSALWPFSTLGWPNNPQELANFYPTSVLITGFDIIFFWVSRMIMFGLEFTNKIPFKDVYITGLVRDSNGEKMSKSKGNILDPLDIINGISLDELLEKRTTKMMQPELADKIQKQTKIDFPEGIQALGADALRFNFAAIASFGRDIKFDLKRTQGYRNFCNKLWNASRYILMNVSAEKIPLQELSVADKWILSKIQRLKIDIEAHIKGYRIDLMSQALYDFVWQEYCDWYLEISKSLLKNDDNKFATKATLINTIYEILILLHPIIPFISEEIFASFKPIFDKNLANADMLINSNYPNINKELISLTAEKEISWVKGFVLGVRQIRGEANIAPNKLLDCYIKNNNELDNEYLAQNICIIKDLANINKIEIREDIKTEEYAIALVEKMQILIPLKDIFDKEQEVNRLSKEISKLTEKQAQLLNKLNNKKFIAKAPKEIVLREKEKLASVEQKIKDFEKQLKTISSL